MNRLLLAALLPLFTFCVAQSQISLRPQIGINFPKLTDEIADGRFKGNAGYQFGVDLQFGGNVYLQPGLNFESTSLSLDDDSGVGDIRISRINIPVYLGFRIASNEDNTFGLRLFVGPNFAIHVNEDLDESLTFINKGNIKDSQVSGVLGAGVDFSILFVDVAYKFGLSDFSENINSDARIDLFFVNVGVRLGG